MIEIGNKKIGEGEPCFVIAEAGVNHNGEIRLAKRLIEEARWTGADAVKFQTFSADRLVTRDAPKASYQNRSSESQFEMLKRLELSAEAHRDLAAFAREQKILFLSTPFDEASADLLETLEVPAFKIGSGELTNLPLLKHVAKKGRPMIVSTGMSTLAEVREAVQAIEAEGNQALILLHCVSAYPADPAEANLRAMATLQSRFGRPVGFSDHTLGTEVALAAVARGACVIEKHLTLDRDLPGSDHQASLNPEEFAEMVRKIWIVESAIGNGEKRPTPAERKISQVARKSLVAARRIRKGSLLKPESITAKRPGTGLSPALLSQLIGRKARQDIREGTLLALEMFE